MSFKNYEESGYGNRLDLLIISLQLVLSNIIWISDIEYHI